MAYSYPYDAYRPKHDSFQSASHDPYAYSSSSNSHYDYDHYYDPMSSAYPPPPPRRTSPRSVSRRRAGSFGRSYPPPPSVEDEIISVAREYPPSELHDNSGEVCMRGIVDQEPMMIEVDNRERRFVLLPGQDTDPARQGENRSSGGKINPREKQRPAPQALRLDTDEPAILTRRQPSPYAFTRTPKTPTSKTSAEYFLSPETLTPPSSGFSKPAPVSNHIRQNVSSGYTSASSRSEFSDDSDLEPKQVAKLRARHKDARVSFTGLGSASVSQRYNSDTSDYEDSQTPRIRPTQKESLSSSMNPPRSVPPEYIPDGQSQTSTSSHYASMLSTPRSIPTPKLGRSHSAYSSRPNIPEFAWPASSLTEPVWLQTPPDSPKVDSQGFSDSPRDYTSSMSGSRPGSRPSSPFASMVDLDQASYLLSRGPTYPSIQDRAPRSTSKLSSTVRQESVETPRIDVHSPAPVRPATKMPLPYPDEQPDVLMPSHERFQIHAEGLAPPFEPREISRPSSVNSATSLSSSVPRLRVSQRPDFSSRHSMVEVVPRARVEPVRMASADAVSRNGSQGAPSSIPIKLPPCPRKDYSKKYDDWYTLDGEPNFDICPTCLNEIVRPTQFRMYFKRAALRPTSVRTRCDFGSPWTRLAWLLTLKRQRQDLDLIYALTAIAHIGPACPGANDAPGPWYGLRDHTGEFIPNFAICPRDLKNLEILFPSLVEAFDRLPQSSSTRQTRTCSLRTESRRFPTYLDLLVETDDKARTQSRLATPDLKPFIGLLRSYAHKPECPRDRIINDKTWHYIPFIPEFTVCEECYDDVIWPSIKQGSEVAVRFNRVLMPLSPAQMKMGGASCQLYSSRMRRVWERACKYSREDGHAYLSRKARERREVEVDLRKQQKEIKRLLDRSGSSGGSISGGVDRDRLRRELKRIESEWLEWE